MVCFSRRETLAERVSRLLHPAAHGQCRVEPCCLHWRCGYDGHGNDKTPGAGLEDPKPGLLEASVRTSGCISHELSLGSRTGNLRSCEEG
jgi:hypothetical protein